MKLYLQTGSTRDGKASQRAFDADGQPLGMLMGKVIVPCNSPEGWQSAPWCAWQCAWTFGDRWLFSFPYHADGIVDAILTWQAIREDEKAHR